jgi:hypothetical protein
MMLCGPRALKAGWLSHGADHVIGISAHQAVHPRTRERHGGRTAHLDGFDRLISS